MKYGTDEGVSCKLNSGWGFHNSQDIQKWTVKSIFPLLPRVLIDWLNFVTHSVNKVHFQLLLVQTMYHATQVKGGHVSQVSIWCNLSLFRSLFKKSVIPSCDTNFATCDRSFWSIFKCLLHFFWRNRKRFLNGTNAILKFDNLASRCNFFRFLSALQLFLINF